MDWESLITDNIPLLLSGGFILSIATLVINWRKARRIAGEERRAQARLPSVLADAAVQGAERTISLMQAINDRLVAQIARDDAEHAAELAERDGRITRLGHDLAAANMAQHEQMNALSRLRRDYDELRAQVARPQPEPDPEGAPQ